MFRARVRLPLFPHFALIGFCLGIGSGQWATVAGQVPRVAQAASAAAPVLVSVTTLDMSRLVPAQFGDWDAAPSTPAR